MQLPPPTISFSKYTREDSPKDPYEIRKLISQTDFSEVYEGWDPRFERKIAIKVFRNSEREFLNNAELEAKTMQRIDDPRIARVYDFLKIADPLDSSKKKAVIIMEFVDSPTLADLLKEKTNLSLEETSNILDHLAGILDLIHEKGIIHHDIKPGNIFVTNNGVKIADFNISNWAIPEDGLTWETMLYTSPEKIINSQVTYLTDIFSLGSVIYEMLTGKKAYEEENEGQTITSIMDARKRILPNTLSKIQSIIDKALTKKPEDRYQTVSEFAQAFKIAIKNAPSP